MAKQPRFGQLDRLADYRDEWDPYRPQPTKGVRWTRGNRVQRNGQRKKPEVVPVDEFIDDDKDPS